MSMATRRELCYRLILLTAGSLVGLLGVEAGTWTLFRMSNVWVGRIPEPLEYRLLRYHLFVRGASIQLRPECSEPDPELEYRLRAGQCRFSTDEFDTAVRVSARHLREETEEHEPDLVVLGDSFSMGWGVERNLAYPALLSQKLSVRVVAAAVSSYGTVRELLLLRRLDLGSFRGVVVQYCLNDLQENRAFIRAGRYEPAPAAEYLAQLSLQARLDGRVVFKRSRAWLSVARADGFRRTAPPGSEAAPEEHARVLLRVLGAFAPDLRGRPVLIFADGFGTLDSAFVSSLNAQEKPAGLGPVSAIEVSRHLSRSDRFLLDVHWRASGHAIVAATVGRALELGPTFGLDGPR